VHEEIIIHANAATNNHDSGKKLTCLQNSIEILKGMQ
jgi:hypothetical protein